MEKGQSEFVKGLGRCGVGVSHTKVFGKEYHKGKSSSQGGCSFDELEAMKASLTQEFEAKLEERLNQRVATQLKAYLQDLIPQRTSSNEQGIDQEQIQFHTIEATQSTHVVEVYVYSIVFL